MVYDICKFFEICLVSCLIKLLLEKFYKKYMDFYVVTNSELDLSV